MQVLGDSDNFQLSTGRVFNANNRIIGLSPDMDVCEGYDGGFRPDDFTPAEWREIADYMIALWEQFKGEQKDAQAD